VDSRLGEGTEIRLDLPLVAPGAQPGAAPPSGEHA
jgi:hypothetical protein